MRLQSTEASCGPNGVANACKGLGLPVTEADVVRWLDRVKKTNPGAEGTTEEQLLRAILEGAPKKYRLRAHGLFVHTEVLARDALAGILLSGRVALLAVDSDTHWAVALAINGPRYIVVDGGDALAEITIPYTWDELRARWESPGDPPRYFGLVISRG